MISSRKGETHLGFVSLRAGNICDFFEGRENAPWFCTSSFNLCRPHNAAGNNNQWNSKGAYILISVRDLGARLLTTPPLLALINN